MNATMMSTSLSVTGPAASDPLRCFPKPPGACVTSASPWLGRWQKQLAGSQWRLGSVREEALAQLIPLLLCGEQSAQHVFSQRPALVSRAVQAELADALERIEQEEAVHECALQGLAARLPAPNDAHRRKRRAQRFYTSLSNGVSLAAQFGRIEALDSAVCQIMYSLARADWSRSHPLYFLFEAIKADEARHVGVSRRYAQALGLSARERQLQRRLIGVRIVNFLQADAAAFECLGVDPARLFSRLSVSEVTP